MRPAYRPRWMVIALCVTASAAMAAPPKQVLVTREVQDLYRVASGTFYIKTTGCQEQVFGDRADLRMNIGSKGGMLLFRNGHVCVIQRFLREVDPNDLGPGGAF